MAQASATIVGNWKMNSTVDQARILASAIKDGLKDLPNVEVAVCPPFTSLQAVRSILQRLWNRGRGAEHAP